MFKKKISDVLYQKKQVKIKGVIFQIKKIDGFNYIDGSFALQKQYDLYKLGNEEESVANFEKAKKHYRDVFLAAVISPRFSRKKEEDGIFVDDLFLDWEIVHKLYSEIMSFTYGKKKLM